MGDYTPIATPADPVATASAQPDAPVLDPNRPVSTISADSQQTPTPVQPVPADSIVQPVPDPAIPVDQVFEATASAEVIPPADLQPPIPSVFPSQPSADPQPVAPTLPSSPVPEVTPAVIPPSVSVPLEAPKESSIEDHSSSNEPSQVQPETPQSAPVIQVENIPPQSAGINPEPPQGTQNAPSADVKLPESPKSSFGDLMGTPADLSEEPAIHIDPIEAPPIAPVTPPVIPPTQPTEENQQAALALRRQHAIEARKQKREENLGQILELAQKKGTVNNLDVRDFLHISQTTATDYLRTLVNSGKLKKAGKAKATMYTL